MLPPRWTRRPAAFSSSAMMEEVVVLPSEPVMPMVRQGQSWKKDLHLARHDRAALFCGDEGGVYGQQARCAEDVVEACEVVQITRAEAELGAARAQLRRGVS